MKTVFSIIFLVFITSGYAQIRPSLPKNGTAGYMWNHGGFDKWLRAPLDTLYADTAAIAYKNGAFYGRYANKWDTLGKSGNDRWGTQVAISDLYTIQGVGIPGSVLRVDSAVMATRYYVEGNFLPITRNYISSLNGDGIATAPIGGGAANFVLTNTTVVPASYTNATLTVDSKGRITAASNGSPGIGLVDGDKGDITVSGTGSVWTIDNQAVTLAKMANLATGTFIGRFTAATGVPEALTGTQATTLLDVFSSTAKGLVPASGGGTTNFLRADGTFAQPAGVSTGQGVVVAGEFVHLGNDDGTTTGQVLVDRFVSMGANSLIFKGGANNAADALLILDDEITASVGFTKTRNILQINALDRTGYTSPLAFVHSVSATAYTGVTRRNNVYNFGWNLSPGGSQIQPGIPAIGESWEHTYIAAIGDTIDAEKHEVYVTSAGLQKRLSSYTIRENIGYYDFYHTVSRFGLQSPADQRVYFNAQPSTSGAQISFAYTDAINFNVIYDRTNGVNFNLAGVDPVSGSRKANFTGFDSWQLPYLQVNAVGELLFDDATPIRSVSNNTTDFGNSVYRWKKLWIYDISAANLIVANNQIKGGSNGSTFGGQVAASLAQNTSTLMAVENGYTGGNAASESYMLVEDNNNYVDIARYNTNYIGNHNGTSIPYAQSFSIHNFSLGNTKPILLKGLPLIGASGTINWMPGFRLDNTGFKVGPNSTLHTSNPGRFAIEGVDAGTNSNILYYNATNGLITYGAPSATGVTTMGAITVGINAYGAQIVGNTLSLSPASETTGGVVTSGTQNFSGQKTFISATGTPLRSMNSSVSPGIVRGLEVVHEAAYTGATGDGIDFIFSQRSSSGVNETTTQLVSKLTNAVSATASSVFEIWGRNSGPLELKVSVAGSGLLTLHGYTAAVTSGAALRSLNVDASGNLVTQPLTSSLAADADFTITADMAGVNLPTITANRNLTFPTAVSGKKLYIHNRNSAAFSWNIVGTTVKDAADATITSITNDTFVTFVSDGVNWYKVN